MKQYLDLLRDIMADGNTRGDRTGTGTRSVFGRQMRFDLAEGFPMVTTKKLHLRAIIHELLWFIAGDTNNESLRANKVSIWDEWALDEDITRTLPIPDAQRAELLMDKLGVSWDRVQSMLDDADLAARLAPDWNGDRRAGGKKLLAEHEISETREVVVIKKGELGPVYGRQWRSWRGPKGEVIDQLAQVIRDLKKNPWSRRHIVTAWNPADMPDESISPIENVKQGKMALAACHCLFQFYVRMMTPLERINFHAERAPDWAPVRDMLATSGAGCTMNDYNNAWFDALTEEQQASIEQELNALSVPDKKLDCQLYQRSCDTFLGVPFNIASYALLTHMVAQVCGMAPGEFVWTGGDVHIYKNHFEQVEEQLKRDPLPLPRLKLNPAIKDIDGFRFEDIEVVGYQSRAKIAAPISV